MKIARRMQRIQPFYVMKLLARARALEVQGRDIVHMEIGEPDFPTPEPIVRAGQRALASGETRYTPALGLTTLRRSIADYYASAFNVELDAGRVVVTPGSSGALHLVLGVVVDPGDQVLLADPGYPCNRHFVELVGGVPVGIPVGPETGYQLNAKLIERAWKEDVSAVLLASPSNPTGTLVSPPEMEAIHRLVRDRGGVLIVDEIYQSLVYGTTPYTVLDSADDVFVVNSFSKYFGMTGWRLGWTVAPDQYIDALDRLAQNIFLAAPTISQHAAMEAFTDETIAILQQRCREFKKRRDFLLPALRRLGFSLPVTPQGAFYLYADCSALSADSDRLALELLEQAGVAVTPGRDFGTNQPEKHLRFAYTTSMERLGEGVDRLRRFLDSGR